MPQAWQFGNEDGISAFIHPEGIYDEPRGAALRTALYPRLRKHFQFRNELKLFTEVHHSRVYSLNVYANKLKYYFESINNLFTPGTIDDCYSAVGVAAGGIKDADGNWNTSGSEERILRIGKKELTIFAKLFDDEGGWKNTRLLALHSKKLLSVIEKLASQEKYVGNLDGLYISEMWNETTAQKDGTIVRDVGFPDNPCALIMAGSQIGVGTPLLKTPRRICSKNSDFDPIDLTLIDDNYLPRSNYSIACSMDEYAKRVPRLNNGERYDSQYRIFSRKMIDPEGARSLVAALLPPRIAHTHGITGISITNSKELILTLACFCSLPVDYMLKATAKANFQASTIKNIPFVSVDSPYASELIQHTLKLNALTSAYREIWDICMDSEWTSTSAYRSDLERRNALVAIDVLVSMVFGLSLDELLTMYRLQFHTLQNQEADTWYDANGRIVFTNNRALNGVGFDRKTWEHQVKPCQKGKTIDKEVVDDTIPAGPVARTITYQAPFERFDREATYREMWSYYEEVYKK